MARNNGGVFGQLRGKIGDVVFSVSRGMQTSRRYQPVVNNPKSVKQEQQRSLFADSVAFVQKQCRFAIANVLKKKYTDTTAYAQLVGSSLSLLRMNELPSEKSKETFEKSWITRSSLGKVIPQLVGGIKVVNGSAKFVADTTLTTVWVGLSLPLNFYEGRNLEDEVEGYLRAVMVAQTQAAGNNLYYIASAGGDTFSTIRETGLPTSELHVVDGVVQARCGFYSTVGDTGAQYALQLVLGDGGIIWYPGSETANLGIRMLSFTNPDGTTYSGNGLYYWYEDSLGNVGQSYSQFTSTILPGE